MALFIRDDEVDALAIELQRMTKVATKKEAVRRALQNELHRTTQASAASVSIADLQRRIAALGPGDPNFDMKSFTDELWGD